MPQTHNDIITVPLDQLMVAPMNRAPVVNGKPVDDSNDIITVPLDQLQPAPSQQPSWSQKLGLHTPEANTLIDMAEGAVRGLVSTGFHGGDLIRRGLSYVGGDALPEWAGGGRVINTPEAQAAMTPPNTIPGKAGFIAEQGAEFAAPLSAVSKATAGASLAARLAAEGAASAGYAGVQSGGDPATMAMAAAAPAVLKAGGTVVKATAGAAQRAAAGAAEGGVGGAIASAVRTVAPPEARRMMVQALKPSNARVNFTSSLNLAMPEIKAVEQASGEPITDMDGLLSAIKTAKASNREMYATLGGPQRALTSQVDGSSVADAIEKSIPMKVARQDPAAADRIRALAESYRTRFSLPDAEQMLRETNAQLEAYYNKFPMAKRRAEVANPEIAHLLAEAKALRSAIYSALDEPGQGEAARELQKRYGALMEVEDAALRRRNVAERQQPESLSEQIGKVRAARDMAVGAWRVLHGDISGAADIAGARAGSAAATYLKEQQTTDALIRRAMAAHTTLPASIQMPSPPTIRGLLPPAVVRLGPGEDRSFVRAVRGEYATVERPPVTIRGLLERPARQMPYVDRSGGRAVAPRFYDITDPNTGEIRRVYLSDAE